MIEVWHFSPTPNLKEIEPRTPSHPDYGDICAVYLATSIHWCRFWANAMTKEGYHKPPFYIYRGQLSIESLFCLKSDEKERFFLVPVQTTEVHSLDQVLSVTSIKVEQAEVYAC